MDAQFNLGTIMHPGADATTQVFQNASRAYFWYALAARNGDSQAGQLAASLGASLKPEDRRRADEAVAAWKALPADAAANEVAPST